MKLAYFDCLSGASGDMIVASLIDAGVDVAQLYEELRTLPIGKFGISTHETERGGIRSLLFEVEYDKSEEHRGLDEICGIIEASSLRDDVKEMSCRIFRRLAEAEGLVHGKAPDEIHFHEVGAVDSIIDIVGAAAALSALGVEKIMFGPLALGSGSVNCEHGVLPVPVPATVELIKGLIARPGMADGELLTPTGAAILTTVGTQGEVLEGLEIEYVGCGCGSRERKGRPNVLRVLVGNVPETPDESDDGILVLETNIDDMSAEGYPVVCEQLLAAGALDAYITPVLMKKGRPGHLLSVLARCADRAQIEEIIFRNTTTLGIRSFRAERSCLQRLELTVETSFGPIRVKEGLLNGEVLRSIPEYEDCRKAAEDAGIPFREVYDAVVAQLGSGKGPRTSNGS